MPSCNQDKLDGWGAIELYLGCTRKAVLRRGYRLHYYRTGRVYALKSELDMQYAPTNARVCPQTSISDTRTR